MLTGCLQAEVFSDLLVVTWVSEVKDAVTSEVHLKSKNTFMKHKMNIFIQMHIRPAAASVCLSTEG